MAEGPLRLSLNGRRVHHFVPGCKIFLHGRFANISATELSVIQDRTGNGRLTTAKGTPAWIIKIFLTEHPNYGRNNAVAVRFFRRMSAFGYCLFIFGRVPL